MRLGSSRSRLVSLVMACPSLAKLAPWITVPATITLRPASSVVTGPFASSSSLNRPKSGRDRSSISSTSGALIASRSAGVSPGRSSTPESGSMPNTMMVRVRPVSGLRIGAIAT
jgi:hypothetical protein